MVSKALCRPPICGNLGWEMDSEWLVSVEFALSLPLVRRIGMVALSAITQVGLGDGGKGDPDQDPNYTAIMAS